MIDNPSPLDLQWHRKVLLPKKKTLTFQIGHPHNKGFYKEALQNLSNSGIPYLIGGHLLIFIIQTYIVTPRIWIFIAVEVIGFIIT